MDSRLFKLTLLTSDSLKKDITRQIEQACLPITIVDNHSIAHLTVVDNLPSTCSTQDVTQILNDQYQLNVDADDTVITVLDSKSALLNLLREQLIRYNNQEAQKTVLKQIIALPQANTYGIVGDSQAVKKLRHLIARLAPSSKAVLITGPTGSGKELVAKALHDLSTYAKGPMVSINCSAVPENLMESLLFGHERGAFTGADRRHHGYFHQANDGTLFLDELGEMPLMLQAKLLRVLESGFYSRVGSASEEQFNGRIIAATHVNLDQAVAQRRFREDLYYRLNVLTIETVSLNDRREDIPILIDFFSQKLDKPVQFSPDAVALLQTMDWSGNVRELKNAIERLSLLTDRECIDTNCIKTILKPKVVDQGDALDQVAKIILQLDVPDKRNAIVNALLNRALREAKGNKSEAARLLGVHRKVVERRFFAQLQD